MTAPCFVDANVFVYTRDPRDGAKQARAVEWLARLWRERSGRTSTQVLCEYYAVATRKLDSRIAPALAWEDVSRFFAWAPYPVDETLLRRAREVEQRWRLSWWDSMVVAAAQLQDCALLLSEDFQDGVVFGGVTARSPFTLGAAEPPAGYASVPAVASRHRGRGRPRKAMAPAERSAP